MSCRVGEGKTKLKPKTHWLNNKVARGITNQIKSNVICHMCRIQHAYLQALNQQCSFKKKSVKIFTKIKSNKYKKNNK